MHIWKIYWLNILTLIVLLMLMSGAARAERPMFTDDPNVSPHRVLTLELGNHFDILNRSQRPVQYINWFDLNFVYGFNVNYEVTFYIPVGIMIYESGAPERSTFGSNDISLALKRVWHTEDEKWGFGIEGRVMFPVESSPVLGTGTESFWMNTMADYTTGGWILRGALGITSPFDMSGNGSVMAGIALRTDTHPDYFGFIELYTETPVSLTDGHVPMLLMVGGGIEIAQNAVLDIGLPISLTDSTVFPGIGIYAGITLEI